MTEKQQEVPDLTEKVEHLESIISELLYILSVDGIIQQDAQSLIQVLHSKL